MMHPDCVPHRAVGFANSGVTQACEHIEQIIPIDACWNGSVLSASLNAFHDVPCYG